MSPQDICARLRLRFGAAILGSEPTALDPWVEVQPAALLEVSRFLREGADLQFDMLHCITAVDYLPRDEKSATIASPPRLEVLYHLSSTVHRHRLVLKVVIPRWRDDVPGQLPQIPSLSSLWRTAEWHEREVYDLSGVYFAGHPDLRRILCPEDWAGHPLRKDYQMPNQYHDISRR